MEKNVNDLHFSLGFKVTVLCREPGMAYESNM